jgi:hypothetical protein
LTLSKIIDSSVLDKKDLVSRIIVFGSQEEKTGIEDTIEELKEVAVRKENENPFNSINSAYRGR